MNIWYSKDKLYRVQLSQVIGFYYVPKWAPSPPYDYPMIFISFAGHEKSFIGTVATDLYEALLKYDREQK